MAVGKTILALCLVSLLISLASSGPLPDVKFGYSGTNGPDKWGSLSPEFELCSKGKNQSPINIVKDSLVRNPDLQPLIRDYVAANATLVNSGSDISLQLSQGVGQVRIGGKNYSLIEMHWRSPSEHTINGERFPMELQLVHKSDDGNITVLAIMYQYGTPDPFLLQIKDKIAELAKEVCEGHEEARVRAGILSTKSLRRKTRKYIRYIGSITTPPCTENVIWNILGKVREMTKEQAAALREPLHADYRNNSRPVQPLNGRKVQLYEESRRAPKSN